MSNRGDMTRQEKRDRSRLVQLVTQKPFLQGSLVDSTLKCGKENCWCRKAPKGHKACYLSIRVGSKRKMIYVPKEHEKQIRECVKNNKEIMKRIATISQCCLAPFLKRS